MPCCAASSDLLIIRNAVVSALSDAGVQRYIEALKQATSPDQQRQLTMYARTNTELMQKLSVLVKAGVLAMAI